MSTVEPAVTTPELAFGDLAARTVLASCGRDLRRRQPRNVRSRKGPHPLAELEQCQWHTVLPTDGVDVDALLTRAFKVVDAVNLQHHECLRESLESYVRNRFTSQQPHDPEKLAEWMQRAGCLEPV